MKLNKKCVFLIVKGWRNNQDRGGAMYGIRAYFEEFTDKDDVELLLKINPAYGIPNLNKLIGEISPRMNGLPRLNINVDNIDYDKMVELYNMGTVFVSPTRAEAYNLPCIEAMACGLPVITTNFGGQTDYVNKDNDELLDKKEIQFHIMADDEYAKLNYTFQCATDMVDVLDRTVKKVNNLSFDFKNIVGYLTFIQGGQ